MVRQSGLFDAEWYRSRNPDVAASGLDPLRHYVEFGASEGRAPGPGFDPDWYVRSYPETLAGGHDPLAHFIRYGAKAGYLPTRQSDRITTRIRDLVNQSGLFDPLWYGRHFPASCAKSCDPFDHYINIGGVAGFPAGQRFDSGRYIAQNPDVAQAGQNPLLHYIRNGVWEGRPCPRVVNDEVRQVLSDGLANLESIEPDLAPHNYVEPEGWPGVLHFGDSSPLVRRWIELVDRFPEASDALIFVQDSRDDRPIEAVAELVVSASDLARSSSTLANSNAAAADLSLDEQAVLAIALAQSMHPRRFLVAGGDAAWRAVALYPQVLARIGTLELVCRAGDLARSERRNALREAFEWVGVVWTPDEETAGLVARTFHLPPAVLGQVRVFGGSFAA